MGLEDGVPKWFKKRGHPDYRNQIHNAKRFDAEVDLVMKTGKILVIGGYGHVGRAISSELAHFFPDRVIAAGRNIQKAGSSLPLS